jgi:hypothetical protein
MSAYAAARSVQRGPGEVVVAIAYREGRFGFALDERLRVGNELVDIGCGDIGGGNASTVIDPCVRGEWRHPLSRIYSLFFTVTLLLQ